MVDFVTALATASQAIKLANDLRGIDKAISESELKLKIADLNSAVADLKNTLLDAKAEAQQKDEDFKFLEKNFLILKETVEAGGLPYDKKADGAPTGLPYCPVCIQKDGYMFHTTPKLANGSTFECPNCKALYREAKRY